MFTGIIEETGKISNINNNSLIVDCITIQKDLKIGDSVAINGVCLTITDYNDKSISAQISPETFGVTTFSELKKGDYVNLERAMMLSSRLGGHIVSGHIDTVCKVSSIIKKNLFYEIYISFDKKYSKYVVKKGSIAVNGISLTIADIFDSEIKIAVIPHTFEHTNFNYLKSGENVNIEFDILAKYVEKNLLSADNSNITIDLLEKNGFI